MTKIVQFITLVHNQCFTAPLSEIEETYSYLIQNWDTVFDQAISY